MDRKEMFVVSLIIVATFLFLGATLYTCDRNATRNHIEEMKMNDLNFIEVPGKCYIKKK